MIRIINYDYHEELGLLLDNEGTKNLCLEPRIFFRGTLVACPMITVNGSLEAPER